MGRRGPLPKPIEERKADGTLGADRHALVAVHLRGARYRPGGPCGPGHERLRIGGKTPPQVLPGVGAKPTPLELLKPYYESESGS